jgi:RNA polymerase primary sigma factor
MKQLKITQRITDRESKSLGVYMNEVRTYGSITPDEEVELAIRIQQADPAALEKLVQSNLRFVISVAKQYQGYGLTLQDLINEGNVGLIKAAQRFDHSRGFKFISYAVWWIRQAIINAIATQSRMVRLPQNKMADLRKLQEASIRWTQENGREPSTEELATFVERPEEEIEMILAAGSRHVSLDAPMVDGEEGSLKDVLAIDSPAADEEILRSSLNSAMDDCLAKLHPREREVIELSFGIGRDNPMKLEDIADEFELTRERIRQIRDRALRKLRNSPGRKHLVAYLG